MIKVQINLKESSQPLEYYAINTYQKGDMYVLYLPGNQVNKFPMINIWAVKEEYGVHLSPRKARKVKHG